MSIVSGEERTYGGPALYDVMTIFVGSLLAAGPTSPRFIESRVTFVFLSIPCGKTAVISDWRPVRYRQIRPDAGWWTETSTRSIQSDPSRSETNVELSSLIDT